jgi:hypothetical protein
MTEMRCKAWQECKKSCTAKLPHKKGTGCESQCNTLIKKGDFGAVCIEVPESEGGLLLTREEITAAHEGETCGDCGEGIAREQLNKVIIRSVKTGWGKMVTKEDAQIFEPLKEEDWK